MHRLTVVQLLPALQSGGVERSTLEIAAALVRAGHRAVVVSAGGRLVQPLLEAGGEHLTLEIGRKSLLTLRHVVGLRRLFAELGADIVHARSRLPAWLGWYALRGMSEATRPRFVTTVHGLNSPSRYSAVMTYGERVICVSQTVREYVCTHYPQTDPARLRTIPRGVDIVQFPRRPQPDNRARKWAQTLLPGLPVDAPLLLLPGRGTRLKGHADGLQLLADVRAAGVPAWLWLPGAREPGREAYVRELEAEAARLGVADAVAFTEPTARIAEAYAASDLVLQLSRKPEAFGRTVVEALSVGRPVLGWAHGGVGELLAELQPGGAVPAFDANALRTQALALLQQAPTPPAVLPYTLQAMQSATLKVYDELRR
ncbi:glycosyltransferase family 4 protein [Xanthomonas sp. 3058]|uniref:glycosyltransferase family 4 protein n=1 Tax=Xanthomonas sp. 3058 TaxID=3035314 RepID=UPI00160A316A|nr:glycosyltransferase family 4 protein [Xanthomonas sp. 3058]MBB5864656.1 glycosyltransferase involved in cell wall biosynthesis [Xanthomonas sp. 3058]